MTVGNWRIAWASVAGTAHLRAEGACQDASDCRLFETAAGETLLLAVVADGAGSAPLAAEGSRIACASLLEALDALISDGGDLEAVTFDFARAWVERFQQTVATRAEAVGAASRDYACTALAAVIGAETGVCFQIGDGAIVLGPRLDPDAYAVAVWPQRGEYENVTNFATDARACDALAFVPLERPVDEVALFSDGLQRLALHYPTESVYAPFFRPMFAPLRSAGPGVSETLSAALERFLTSDSVNRRTDDDKTLVLATRRPPEAAVGA